MTINHEVYDTATMLTVLRDNDMMAPPSNYWLSLAFQDTVNFDDEYIDFSQLCEVRKLAPLVVPTSQGKPIYSNAEKMTRVKPAYVKPKDAVTATRMIRRVAGLGELSAQTPQSPQQRYLAVVADILRQHRRAIERRWEWMASEAVQFGKVTLEDEAYPLTVVDFERDAAHDVTLTAGNFWGDAGVSIVDGIQGYVDLIRDAKFGGPTNRLTIGSDVWKVMRKDNEVRELLNVNFRQDLGEVSRMNLGLREGLDVERVGSLSGVLDVYVYSDYYQNPDGTTAPFMSPKDIVLTGPNIQGVQCFGAIQDIGAQFQSAAMWPKMWNEQDPSVTYIMTQSAPLPVPVMPNNSLRATVVA